MKNGISKGKRFILIVLASILIAVTFFTSVIFMEDSTMRVQYGDDVTEYFIPFFSRDSVAYEDSVLFKSLFNLSIRDIIRMSVIKNQMETNGKYEPDKKIDINEYANRTSQVAYSGKKVEYNIDDLINWGNKGFTTQLVTLETLPFADLDEYENETGVEILVSRYKSSEGRDLASYASTYREYCMLMDNLRNTATELFSNYREYVEYSKEYGVGKSNVLYCVQMYNDGKPVRFTNMDVINATDSADDITSMFNKLPKYLYYNPDKMTISTNTAVTAYNMQDMMSRYMYAFNDNSRIWIGFDGTYAVNDGFANGKNYYDSKVEKSNAIVLVSVIWIAFFAYLSTFVFLVIKEGRPYHKKNENEKESEENTIVLKKIDHTPIELLLILTIVVISIDMLMGYLMIYQVMNNLFGGVWLYAVVILIALFLNFTFMPHVLMYVRKLKAKNMTENSCIKWILDKIRETTIDAYDHGHALIRTWIPYIIYLLFNLVFVLTGLPGLVVAFIIDMIIGVFLYKNNRERQEIVKSINIISNSDVKHQMDTSHMHGDNLELANAVNNIGNGISKAVETSMKNEKTKADLITNVSHDIKTPLTSIINYVDLLKRENIQDEKISGYINILDQKSQRLKQLTDDLVEASKISSGNIVLHFEKINIVELINQSIGEYEDKLAEHGLKCRLSMPEKPVYISADSKSIFRVIENLYNNIYKYALHGTRVYIDVEEYDTDGINKVQISVKNISESQLNMSVEDLLERFKQGDESRKTEGSGLGLSIAKSLTEAMNGQFDLSLDGDLFKVILSFNTI